MTAGLCTFCGSVYTQAIAGDLGDFFHYKRVTTARERVEMLEAKGALLSTRSDPGPHCAGCSTDQAVIFLSGIKLFQ